MTSKLLRRIVLTAVLSVGALGSVVVAQAEEFDGPRAEWRERREFQERERREEVRREREIREREAWRRHEWRENHEWREHHEYRGDAWRGRDWR
jgi:hypothetical protein